MSSPAGPGHDAAAASARSPELDEVLAAARAGDTTAFGVLYRETQPRLLRYASSLVAVGAECAIAGLIYFATFVIFSLSAIERHFYFDKLVQMLHIVRLRPAEEPL